VGGERPKKGKVVQGTASKQHNPRNGPAIPPTANDYNQRSIAIWGRTSPKTKRLPTELFQGPLENPGQRRQHQPPFYNHVGGTSGGPRFHKQQIRQLSGMRGLMAKGLRAKVIENRGHHLRTFREGLTGLANTSSPRTAAAQGRGRYRLLRDRAESRLPHAASSCDVAAGPRHFIQRVRCRQPYEGIYVDKNPS